MDYPPIVVEVTYSAFAEKVWKAITERDQMVQWFFDNIPDFKAEVGFRTEFPVVAPSQTFIHIWTVTEVVPNKKLTYKWNFGGFKSDAFTTFELTEEGTQTTLKLTAVGGEGFLKEKNIPEFERESGVGGWNYFLGESLKKYLAK